MVIISRTPARLSLLGGSSDFESWYSLPGHYGLVVGGALKKYSFISARYLPPIHPFKTKVVYNRIETVNDNNDIEHSAIRATLQYLGIEDGVEIFHQSDLPSRSGVGSSSSFVVGLVHALSALKGHYTSPAELAHAAIHIEQKMLGETVGCQDQTWAAYGGINQIHFRHEQEIVVSPIPISTDKLRQLENGLMLFFTGQSRTSSDVAKTYAPDLAKKENMQWALLRLAEEAVGAVRNADLKRLGKLMDQSWRIKRDLSAAVTNSEIDLMYEKARLAGAYGGKLIGAGGGGCIVLAVPEERKYEVRSTLDGLVEIPVRFDFDGSRIIFASNEEDYES